MRSVADFYQDCMAVAHALPPLDVQLADAVSCVLAEDVQAPFNLPVADLSACDGYAVRIRDCEGATLESPVTLPVTEEIRAGAVDPAALVPGTAIRIASGAPMPSGAEAVVSLEFTDHGIAQVALRTAPASGENIRRRAEDVAQGDTVLRAGTRIGARQMALLAGVGRDRVLVHPRPRVVIISIGDEIVEPGGEARPGTVFDANGHALSTAVADAGAQTFRVAAVPDERARLRETIEDQLVRADLILTTGGISYGSGDTVREVLGALGTVRFDNVAAWPGHIMGVGTVGAEDGQPGTPIVRPGLLRSLRPPRAAPHAGLECREPPRRTRRHRPLMVFPARPPRVRARAPHRLAPLRLQRRRHGHPGLVAAVRAGGLERSRSRARGRDHRASRG